MKLDNTQREKIAKAQNITSLIGKKIAAEKSAKDSKESKVDLNNLAAKLADRRENNLQEEG